MSFTPVGRSNVRRTQICEVFHSVWMMLPGGLPAPKPDCPAFHELSSNADFSQPLAGLSVVYFQVAGCVRASGRSVLTFGGGPCSALAAAAARAGSTLITARS